MKKILALSLMFALCLGAHGDSISFTLENDFFSNSDDNYTHGTEVTYKFGDQRVKLSQVMYTPEDLREERFIEDDRPYAGILLLSYGREKVERNKYRYVEGGIGILGEDSFAGETQTWVHEALDNKIPKGWDNQIEKGFVFTLNLTQKYRVLNSKYFELTPFGGLEVGSLWDYVRVGIEPRVGFNIENDFGEHIIQPTDFNPKDISFYLYGISEARAVFYNTTLDGVDPEDFVFDYGGGMKLVYKDFGFNFSHIFRSKEFDNGHEQGYSSITIEYGW